jgi:hypothetical protein
MRTKFDMAESTEAFKLKNRHLSSVIRILQAHIGDDPEGDVNLSGNARDDVSLCSRLLGSGVGSVAVKDSDLGTKTTPTQGGEHGNKDRELHGTQETARGDKARASDSRATARVLAAARDSRMNGPSSPFSGCPDFTPGRAPLARDGRIYSIDSLLLDSAGGGGASVAHSVDDIFHKPTLAEG